MHWFSRPAKAQEGKVPQSLRLCGMVANGLGGYAPSSLFSALQARLDPQL